MLLSHYHMNLTEHNDIIAMIIGKVVTQCCIIYNRISLWLLEMSLTLNTSRSVIESWKEVSAEP